MKRLFLAVTLLAVTLPALAAQKVICIDPGHGGSDPGAVGCGLEEATVVLDVAWRLHALLQSDADLKPVMTRTADAYVSLQGRCNYANDKGATRFASLHCNAFNGSASGIETFAYTNGSASSFDQRDRIQDWMTETWPKLPDRGGKTAGYYVIKNTSMPATLSELAFIDKCSLDATYLADDSALQAAAIAHHQALRESLGLSSQVVEPTDPPVVPPDDGTGVLKGAIFEDQGVGTEDMSLRLAGAWVEAANDGTYEAVNATAPAGEFLIPLPAGQYKIMVSLNGYYTNERSCTITTGNDTWCSVGLFKKPGTQPPALGTLRGIVYEDQGVGSSDTSVPLPGAKIVTDNQQGTADQVFTSAPGAEWLFEVPPGTYTVTSIHNGHWTNTRLCEVHAGQTTWCSVGMFKQDQGTPPDPPADGGILLGAIYLADENGNADLNIRLPGAKVAVEGAGLQYEAMSSEPYGLWSFALPEGTYTVTANLDGYWPNSRTCPVGTGVEVWCSVGLLKNEGGYGGPDDPSTPAVESGDPESIVPAVAEPQNEDPQGPGQPLVIPPEDAEDAGGCGTGPASGSAVLLLLMLSCGVLTLRRTRWLYILPLMAFAAPSTMADETPGTVAARDLRVLAVGEFAHPLLSSDGRFLALTNPRLDRLSAIDLRSNQQTEIAHGDRVGYEPRWLADGNLGIRLPHQARHEVPALSRSVSGDERTAPRNITPGRWIRVIDDVVYLQTGPSRRKISPDGDSFYGSEMSPDGSRILFHGLTTGVYVHDIPSGRTSPLGLGTNARFGPDSSNVVFDRCADDGDFITSCQVFLATASGDKPSVRTITGLPKLAHQPSLGPDGMLVFEADGVVWVGTVE